MSLKVWLPLQGTLENKGISDIVVDGHSSTVDTTNGKLALSCQKFARASAQYLSFPAFLEADDEFTYCCWFKTASVAQTQCLFSQRTEASSTGFSIFYLGATTGTNADTVRFDDGATLYSSGTSGKISTTNKWYHLAFVRTSTHKYIYINGVLVGSGVKNTPTKVNTNYAVIGGSQGSNSAAPSDNMLNGYLQDVRIYNHALSAAEIKKLSQGLIAHYKLDDDDFLDSSGYENNMTKTGAITCIVDNNGRYGKVANVTNNASYLMTERSITTAENTFSFNIWYNPAEYVRSAFVATVRFTDSLMFNFGCTGSGSQTHQFNVFRPSNYITCRNWSFPLNEWHMWTGTYDGTTVKIYKDGQLVQSNATVTSYTSGTTPRSHFLGSATPVSLKAKASDIRIYATTLSADDIKELYETSLKLDDLGNTLSYELVENSGNKLLQNGQLLVSNVVEDENMQYLKYDHNIYFEPDGSAWVHIYHHNAPSTYGVFTHADDSKVTNEEFEESIYLDEHRWFNVGICNYVDKWEIMTVRRAKDTNNFVVNRWIQPANPMTAEAAEVLNDLLTIISGSTYMNENGTYNSSYSYNGYGYLGNTAAFIYAYTGTSTSYYGAIGQKQFWNGGNTPFNSTSKSNAITTGSVDLYLRIDNVTFTTPTKTKVTEYGTWSTHEIIEC